MTKSLRHSDRLCLLEYACPRRSQAGDSAPIIKMPPCRLRILTAIIAFTMCLVLSSRTAFATTVQANVSTDSCYLDEVITLSVQIENPTQASAPTAPTTPDFDIVLRSPNPSRNQQTTISNNKMTSTTTYTYVYDVHPKRIGRLTIPSFQVVDGGNVYQTGEVIVTVKQAGGVAILYGQVIVDRDVAFVGEPINLKLEVWIRKYSQQGIGSLDVRTMWQLRDVAASRYGVFQKADLDTPKYRETQRPDENGTLQDYTVFSWETSVYPSKVGPFDFGDIVIAWSYPTMLSRSFFGLEHARNPRSLRATPDLPKLEVRPLPTEGRPGYFSGAVGKFTIFTSAAPREAAVGDPITLTMEIRGDVSLDRVRAPKLSHVEELTKNFEISGESLGGELQDNRKIFRQTIRALHENMTEIPKIPFSFFNPATAKYETAWSNPIPVKIEPARKLALPQNPEAVGDSSLGPAPLKEASDGLLANYADPNVLLSTQNNTPGVLTASVLAGLPLIYAAVWFVTWRSRRLQGNVALVRRRNAYSHARKALSHNPADVGVVSNIVLTYVADRCNVPAGGLTRADAMQLLAQRNVPEQTRRDLDAFLESLEFAEYGGGTVLSVQEAAKQAQGFIDSLEHCDLK